MEQEGCKLPLTTINEKFSQNTTLTLVFQLWLWYT